MSKKKQARRRVVFLFDVDNTLLNNDQVAADLQKHLASEVGADGAKHYWQMFETLRREMGYADYLGALQSYRLKYPHDLRLLTVSKFLIDYPFANRLFAGSLDAIRHVQQWGNAVLLTDGDVVFQPHKVRRSGLFETVDGHVLVYVHKQRELSDVVARYPSGHYVMMDDKLHVLAGMKKIWGKRLTTVFVRQGHYALDKTIIAENPPPDMTIERIGDLINYGLGDLLAAAHPRAA